MGIPRLTGDVSAYAENVVLGTSTTNSGPDVITRLVIDGPSLVYHVYNRLQLNTDGQGASFINQPSYGAISQCFVQFLTDLNSHGVQIMKVVFDGALPLSKRHIRQDRLEKTRQNLQRLRDAHTNDADLNSSLMVTSRPDASKVDHHNVLWSTDGSISMRNQLLPPPPFMVAAVIEHLLSSQWARAVHMVPDEADPYCASEAANSNSAVLSNDSDLVVHNLGANGSVVILRTVERVKHLYVAGKTVIQAQLLQPTTITRSLNVPSMSALAFQRQIDPDSTTSVIAQRARTYKPCEDDCRWNDFCAEYQSTGLPLLDHQPSYSCQHCSIRGLDPRTAELVCSIGKTEELQLFLPIVLEDPCRDASWSYGIQIRRLAYSILLNYYSSQAGSSYDHITEFARKGPHIGSSKVQILSPSVIKEESGKVSDILKYHLQIDSQDEKNSSGFRNRQMLKSDVALLTSNSTLIKYLLLAADHVATDRLSRNKGYEPSLSRILVCENSSKFASTALTWDDIHFYSNLQSVLYSFRMLKQIVDNIICGPPQPGRDGMCQIAKVIADNLSDMPTIIDLFPHVSSVQQQIQNCPLDRIENGIRKVRRRIEPLGSGQDDSIPAPETVLDKSAQVRDRLDLCDWNEGGTLKRRRLQNNKQSKIGTQHGNKLVQALQQNLQITNPFSTLSESSA